MNSFPPILLRLAVATVMAVALISGGCESRRDEDLAGLVVVSQGTVGVTNAAGEPEPIGESPSEVRRVTAANGRMVAQTQDGRFLVSDLPRSDESRSWRPISVDPSSDRAPSGIDLSPDGRLLAIAMGSPDTPGMELATVDVETGETVRMSLDLMANGPPSWLGPKLLALEVIRPDQHSGIVTVNATTGDVTITDAQGIEPSPTRDGSRVAVETLTGLVITDTAGWLAGASGDASGIAPPVDASVHDVALDADGTRLAVVYSAASGTASSIVILRLAGTVWESVTSVQVRDDALISIDWLD